MTPASDIDIAVLHVQGATETVTAALEEIGDTVQKRFGNRLSFILTDATTVELRGRGAGSRLWEQILREGIPILEPHPERAVG